MATRCWTQVRSFTVATCVVDSPFVSSACWSLGRALVTLASISVAPPIKTSSMVMTWTSRRRTCSASHQGEQKGSSLWLYRKFDMTTGKCFFHTNDNTYVTSQVIHHCPVWVPKVSYLSYYNTRQIEVAETVHQRKLTIANSFYTYIY